MAGSLIHGMPRASNPYKLAWKGRDQGRIVLPQQSHKSHKPRIYKHQLYYVGELGYLHRLGVTVCPQMSQGLDQFGRHGTDHVPPRQSPAQCSLDRHRA